MTQQEPILNLTTSGRFDRFDRIEWWDQARLDRAKVLVIGAGALGNEVIKNLSLLGVGHLVIVDMDQIEASNLCRSVLFRPEDDGQGKAACAARAARSIYPPICAEAVHGNVLAELGLGYFRWADVVVGALDNREARLFVNRVCAMLGRQWFDGGIDVLDGVVRGFAPPETACYECTMSEVDWDIVNQRRSCSLLARRAVEHGGTPTTPTTASIIGAIQAQEVVKLLHGKSALSGRGYVFDGKDFEGYRVGYPVNPDCPWHDGAIDVEPAPALTLHSTLRDVWQAADKRLGRVDALEFARELVDVVRCPDCVGQRRLLAPAETVSAHDLLCEQCQTECAPTFLHGIGGDSDLLDHQLSQLHFPTWDIIWARSGQRFLGIEISGDRPTGLAAPDDVIGDKSETATN